MKRYLLTIALLLMAFSFSSCEEDRWGYDNRVVFSAAGGDEDVDGDIDAPLHSLSIGDGQGDEKAATEVAGVLTVTYDWLTALVKEADDEIHLVAQRNTTGKKRKLIVFGMVGNRVLDITVVQNK